MNKLSKLIAVALLFHLLSLTSYAQNVGINDDGSLPNANAVLHVQSTSKGFLIPRMTTAQRTAFAVSLGTTDEAMMVYDTDLGNYYYWTGTIWDTFIKTSALLADADGDTKIQVEESADEDIIRFDIAGTEQFVFYPQRIDMPATESVFMGQGSGKSTTTETWSVGLGAYTLNKLTTGYENVAVGEYSLQNNTTGNGNVGLGGYALNSLEAGHYNIAIGYSALMDGTTAENNIAIGRDAGYNNNGQFNVFLGFNAGRLETGSHKLYIESSNPSGTPLIYGDFSTDSLRLNATTHISKLNINDSYTFPTIDGTNGQLLKTDGSGNLSWGNLVLEDSDSDTKIQVEESADEDVIRFDVAGTERFRLSTDNSSIINDGYFSGDLPSTLLELENTNLKLAKNTSGNTIQSLIIEGSMPSYTYPYARVDFQNNDGGTTYIGASIRSHNANASNSGDLRFYTSLSTTRNEVLRLTHDRKVQINGSYSLPIGDGTTGQLLTTDGSGNLSWTDDGIDTLNLMADTDKDTKIQVEESTDEDLIRFDLAGSETYVFHNDRIHLPSSTNAFIGQEAGISNLSNGFSEGMYSVGVGAFSLRNHTTGSGNTALGAYSLFNLTSGKQNIGIGESAGVSLTTGQGNVIIGNGTLGANNTGNYNVVLGLHAGSNNTGSRNVFLGKEAGYNETGSDKLYIENSTSSTPLIWGDFANDSIKVYGTLSVGDTYTFPTVDGTNGQVLTTDGTGTISWTNAADNDTLNFIADTDKDTKIQVEESTDEDKIRFDVAGTEAMIISETGKVGIGIESPLATLHIGMEKTVSSTAQLSVAQTIGTISSAWAGNANNWQSFTAVEDGELDSVLLNFNTTATGTRTLTIYEGEGTSGTLLFTTSALNVAGGGWFGFPISGVSLTAGQQYTFYINSRSYLLFTDSDPYTGGIYGHAPSFDFAFQIYVKPMVSDPTKGFLVEEDGVTINTYKLPATDGSNGQVLATDGAGTMSWINFTDSDNQTVDKFSLIGNTLSLSLLNDGASDYTVDLSSINTDNQTVDKFSLTGNTLSLSLLNDGVADYTVDFSSYLKGTGTPLKMAYFDAADSLVSFDDWTIDPTNKRIGFGMTTPSAKFCLWDSTTTANATGFQANLRGGGAGNQIGFNANIYYDNAGVVTADTAIGYKAYVEGDARTKYGFYSYTSGGTETYYAYYGQANGGNNNYGIRAEATGGVNNYGLYASASGGSSANYAGFFDKGTVHIGDALAIGTPIPDEELHVVGNIKMVDGNQGNGKVLISDANGVGSWTTLTDADNQTVDKFSLLGNTLSLSLLNDGVADYTVDLSSINTDKQTIDKFSLTGSILSLSLENDGISDYTVDLSSLVADTLSLIADADKDTKIEVEKNADEDKIRFDVAGTEAMIISETGNVGIGIESPLASLHIGMEKTISSTAQLSVAQTTGTVSSAWPGNANNWQSFTAIEDGELDNIQLNFNTSATGLRTLTIYEGEGTSGTLLYTTSSINVSGGGWFSFPISGVNITAGQQYTFYINTRAYLLFTSGDPYAGGIYGHAPSFDFAFQIYVKPLVSDPTKGFIVEEDGVTINTYKLPATDGSNGQVLATDGAGTMSWTSFSDSDNQTVDKFSLLGSTLSLSLLNDGTSDYTVDLSSINTDNQTVDKFSLAGSTLSLSLLNDGASDYTVDLSSINTDKQTVDKFSLTGTTLSLSLQNDGVADYTVNLSGLAADTLTLISDTNKDTKIQVEASSNEDKIRFDVAGTEAMIIDDAGNVGIGTSSPAAVLDVNMGQITLEEVMVSQATHSVYFSSGGLTWQSFTATKAGELTNISVYINNASPLSKTVNIYEGEGTGGTLLYTSATVTSSGVGFLDIPITGSINLVVGNQYTFELQQESVGYISGNVYTGGVLFGVPFLDMAFTVSIVNYEGGNFQVSNNGVKIYNYTLPVKDGTANQALITDGAGTVNWTTLTDSDNQTVDKFSLSGSTLSLSLLNDGASDYTVDLSSLQLDPTKLIDGDGDTKIDVEESADEDIIRFDLGGSEFLQLNGKSFHLPNSDNVLLGKNAGTSLTSDLNVAIGTDALAVSGADRNVAIGYQALNANSSGTENVAIGYWAGKDNNGSGNVFLGRGAGESTTVSNQLFITNYRTNSPLIWGDFASKSLIVHGSLGVDGQYTFPTTDGTAGQTLITDGAGTLSWIDPSVVDNLGNHTATSNIRLSGNWLSNDGGNEGIYVATNGNVGVGTSSTTQGKLVVSGTGSAQNFTGIGYLVKTGAGSTASTFNTSYSIYASGHIAAEGFIAFSDRRIKNIQGISNSTDDLNTLMDIEITDYSLIDTVAKGSKAYKKVIAQQVKEVFPQAVTDNTTEAIPDIYQTATAQNDGWIQLATDLKVGDQVQIIYPTEKKVLTVIETTAKAFKVASDFEGTVFVFGRQVNDFHAVDYEAISMLNVSATQELYKQFIRMQKENENLKTQLNELKHLKNRLAKIEALLAQPNANTPATLPATTDQK